MAEPVTMDALVRLALQLPFMEFSESMGNQESGVVVLFVMAWSPVRRFNAG
jgi:hypothetical protein